MSCEKITLFIAVTLLVTSGYAVSQERNSAEEIFRWFPGGYYFGASHKALSELEKEECFEDFLHYFDAERGEQVKPLPERFAEGTVSMTSASIYSYEPGSLINSSLDTAGDSEDPGYDKDWSRIYVYRNADMARLFAEALEAGEFKDTGKRISGNPVCSFGSDYFSPVRKTVSQYYVIQPTPNELLLAESLSNLKRMFRTGGGLEYGFLDEDDHKELIHLLPELGSRWGARFRNTENRLHWDRAIRRGADTAYKERLQSWFEENPMYRISTHYLDERILFREIAYFESSAAAGSVSEEDALYAREVNTNYPVATQNYERQKINKTRTRRDGNMIIRELEYDDELIRMSVESREAMREWFERNLPEARKRLEQEEANKK